jgi:hypothetical protein
MDASMYTKIQQPAVPVTVDIISRELYALNPAFDLDKARHINRKPGPQAWPTQGQQYADFKNKCRKNSVALLTQALLAVAGEKVKSIMPVRLEHDVHEPVVGAIPHFALCIQLQDGRHLLLPLSLWLKGGTPSRGLKDGPTKTAKKERKKEAQ